MPELCKARPAAESEDSEPALLERAPGGTTAGAGGAGAGASGLVQSTLGVGTAVPSYDPTIVASVGAEHQTTPLANQRIYGVPLLQHNTGQAQIDFSQAFATGSSISFELIIDRQT